MYKILPHKLLLNKVMAIVDVINPQHKVVPLEKVQIGSSPLKSF